MTNEIIFAIMHQVSTKNFRTWRKIYSRSITGTSTNFQQGKMSTEMLPLSILTCYQNTTGIMEVMSRTGKNANPSRLSENPEQFYQTIRSKERETNLLCLAE